MGLGKTLTILAYLRSVKDDKEREQQKRREKEEKKVKEEKKKKRDDDDDDENDEELYDTKRIFKKKYQSKQEDSDVKRLRTLIILPASLLNQWVGEIKKRFSSDAFKYHTYHDTNRKDRAYNLEDNDIVFTTYEIVSREMDIFDKDGNATVTSVSL
jgi:hypothetical protein